MHSTVLCKSYNFPSLTQLQNGHLREAHSKIVSSVAPRPANNYQNKAKQTSEPLLKVKLIQEPATQMTAGGLFGKLVLEVETRLLARQHMDISMVDIKNRIIPKALERTAEPLKFTSSQLIVDNLKLASLEVLQQNTPLQVGESLFRLRFQIGTTIIYSQFFTINK